MRTHTPGPWRLWLSPTDPGLFTLHGDSPEPHGNDMVITKRDCGTLNGAEGIANARLIAAAPAMLDALYVAAEALDNYSDVNDGDDGQPVANRAMSALREIAAAIAKAEGAQ